MKRCFLLCSILFALCALAYANQEIVNLGVTETKEGITMPMSTEEIQAEIDALSAQIMAAKQTGIEPAAALRARLAELEGMLYEPEGTYGHLDEQGGETCALAYEITALPFCGGGTLGATTDCNPTTYPYRDVFYKFTPTTTGTYRASMCASLGDTYLKIWATTCCSGTAFGTDDEGCGGNDPAKDFTLTAGTTYFFEVGNYYSTDPAWAYFFNLFGPIPTGAPANDACASAIGVGVPSSTMGTTRSGTNDTPGACGGATTYYAGVWYTVTGNGHNLTARTYNNCSSFNTRITVFRGTCTALVCVGGNADYGTSSSLSQYIWCADAGVTYYVLVTNQSSATASSNGPFKLDILDGASCACDDIPLCGTPTETEPNSLCAQLDPFHIDCAETVYGLHCPEADSDLFAVTVPPMTVMWLYHYDGLNCNVNPSTGVQSRLYDANCVLLGGPTTVGWRLTNPLTAPWDIIADIAPTTNTYRTPYKVVTWCCDIVDYCANPIIIPSVTSYTNTANSCCATNPVPTVWSSACGGSSYTSGNDIVYQFTISSPKTLVIVASGTGDNQVMVFTSCANPVGTCVASSDAGNPETIVVTLPAGTYYISTSIYGTGCGDITLTVTGCDVIDYCANPIILPGVFSYTNTANTCCATNPVPCVKANMCTGSCYTSGKDVVYRFTILSPGILTLVASGTGDNQLLVFSNCADPESTYCVASMDAGVSGASETISNLSLPAGTYYASTSLYSTNCGDITLTITSDVPLPVELTTLEAVAADRQVTLRWATASEWDNAYFEVQRKAGAAAWMTVGKVDGVGNSQTTHNYEYVDRAVVNNVTYTYRLLSHDINGAVQEYDMMAEATPGMPIPTEYALEQNHPNPFNPNTSISYSVKEAGFVTLKVYNLIGQEVATLVSAKMEAGRYTANFSANDLPSGVYVYRLEVNNFTAQKKMVLLK